MSLLIALLIGTIIGGLVSYFLHPKIDMLLPSILDFCHTAFQPDQHFVFSGLCADRSRLV